MRSLFVAALVAALPMAASAASLTGDTVTINLTSSSNQGDQTVTVGAGEDANYFGNQFIDFDAGPNADLFTIRSTGNFGSIDGAGDNVVWTLTGLDFDSGEPLTDFEVLTTIAPVTTTIGPDSLIITYLDTTIPLDVYFSGRFVTGSPVQPIPLPGALAFMLAGLGGLGLVARRKTAARA